MLGQLLARLVGEAGLPFRCLFETVRGTLPLPAGHGRALSSSQDGSPRRLWGVADAGSLPATQSRINRHPHVGRQTSRRTAKAPTASRGGRSGEGRAAGCRPRPLGLRLDVRDGRLTYVDVVTEGRHLDAHRRDRPMAVAEAGRGAPCPGGLNREPLDRPRRAGFGGSDGRRCTSPDQKPEIPRPLDDG